MITLKDINITVVRKGNVLEDMFLNPEQMKRRNKLLSEKKIVIDLFCKKRKS